MNKWLNYYAIIPANVRKSMQKEKTKSRKKLRKSEQQKCRKHRKEYCENCWVPAYISYPSVHHIKPICLWWSVKDWVITLCERCHRFVHTINWKLNYSMVDEKITEKFLILVSNDN